jgi:hypothetical protein
MKCAECDTTMRANGKCSACGWSPREKRPSEMSASERETAAYADERCKWERGGRQCRLLGTISRNTHGGPFYCSWHDYCLSNHDCSNSKEELARFQDMIIKGSINGNQFTQFSLELLSKLVICEN